MTTTSWDHYLTVVRELIGTDQHERAELDGRLHAELAAAEGVKAAAARRVQALRSVLRRAERLVIDAVSQHQDLDATAAVPMSVQTPLTCELVRERIEHLCAELDDALDDLPRVRIARAQPDRHEQSMPSAPAAAVWERYAQTVMLVAGAGTRYRTERARVEGTLAAQRAAAEHLLAVIADRQRAVDAAVMATEHVVSVALESDPMLVVPGAPARLSRPETAGEAVALLNDFCFHFDHARAQRLPAIESPVQPTPRWVWAMAGVLMWLVLMFLLLISI